MTRVADASLAVGVTAAAHSIVFQFTLTFRFPFDTVVEREPPPCSPFYCLRVISGSSTPRFRPNYLIFSPLIRARTTRSRERKERKAGGWFEFFFFFLPTFTRLGHGDKEELSGKRESR